MQQRRPSSTADIALIFYTPFGARRETAKAKYVVCQQVVPHMLVQVCSKVQILSSWELTKAIRDKIEY